MRKKVVFILGILFLGGIHYTVLAQQKAKTGIERITVKGSDISFTISSDKKFIYGGNRYVLHIGEKVYMRCFQSHEKGKGFISFLIPQKEFEGLQDGKKVYLSYGNMESDEAELEQLCKRDHPGCWFLGRLNKALLSK